MSQHKLTDNELNTFARYLWEHGDKRKLEAFRATFPDSRATDRSASANAVRIFDGQKANILLTIEKLQKQSAKDDEDAGCGLRERKSLYSSMIALAKSQMKTSDPASADASRAVRNALGACDHLNKLDGSYAPEKIENLTAYGAVELTRGPVGSKAPSAG